MDAWIPITLLAAAAQTYRFVQQKRLSGGLSPAGATFARFLFSAPFVPFLVFGYATISGQSVPGIPAGFWLYALSGGLAQVLATMCVVSMFSRRNFAIGMTFKKTEVLMSALVGLAVLGEGVTAPALGAMALGLCGVLLISDPPGGTGRWIRRIANPSTGLGLTSGLFFAISGVAYRGGSLMLPSGDAPLRALVTLSCVTAAQVVGMALWIGWRERGRTRARGAGLADRAARRAR